MTDKSELEALLRAAYRDFPGFDPAGDASLETLDKPHQRVWENALAHIRAEKAAAHNPAQSSDIALILRSESTKWRDDAFESSALIVERYFGEDAVHCAADIRALKDKGPTK